LWQGQAAGQAEGADLEEIAPGAAVTVPRRLSATQEIQHFRSGLTKSLATFLEQASDHLGSGQGVICDQSSAATKRVRVDGHDAGVLQLTRHLHLAHEPAPEAHVGPVGAQSLQRHLAAQVAVADKPHPADAAGPGQPQRRTGGYGRCPQAASETTDG
jgi:hypothetical protein